MSPKVICAFAGLGKTYLSKKHSNVIDHDISKYKYISSNYTNWEALKATEGRIKNEAYPNNWLTKLNELLQTDNIILVPADLEIRNILLSEKIEFIFIIPSLDSKHNLVERYIKRGNNENFIKRAVSDLEEWHSLIPKYQYKTIILPKDKYLEDLLLEQNIL